MNSPMAEHYSIERSDRLTFATKGLDPSHAVAGENMMLGGLPVQADADGDLIKPLREIATPYGRTHAAQLATSIHTDGVDNIFSSDLSPGGSSGGSAVAVASGEVDFATATDAGGSVRIPSALAGLFAIKPTPGLLPPEHNDWGGLSVSSIIAKNVGMTASVLDHVLDANEHENGRSFFSKYLTEALPQQKIVMLNSYYDQKNGANSANSDALSEAKEIMDYYGHTVVDKRDDGLDLEDKVSSNTIAEAFVVIMAVSVAHAIEEAEKTTGVVATRSVLTDSNWALREMGRDYQSTYNEAIQEMKNFGQIFLGIIGDDVLMLPTLDNPTPTKEDMEPSKLLVAGAVAVSALSIAAHVDLNRYLGTAKSAAKNTPLTTAVANLAGVPAATNPVGWTTYKGMRVPVGIQTVAKPNADNVLIGLGAQFE